ncbi:transglycosylase [Arthrobacter alpinus]|uniref:Transglycosylase n=1 Tax=Arthrobacter alpinus TaxID=656366 RepID=A0A0M5M3E3_9MICC|nr:MULTISPECIES: resuscitation-promoting factor [Arthrobacter]ALE91507.1 transglycosylase [Arthrobacter alpinus]
MSFFYSADGKLNVLKIAGQAAVLIALVAGLVMFAGTNKSVSVMVDGQASSVQTFGGSVAQVLDRAQVQVGASDQVTPDLNTQVSDGTAITVNTAKKITVNLDGAEHNVTTTSAKIGGLISQLGVAANARVSVPADAILANASDISIITPKVVTVIADGKKNVTTTTAETVAEVLASSGVTVAPADLVSVPGVAKVVENMVVKVSRVNTDGAASETSAVPFDTEHVVDPALFKDQKTTTRAGVAGTLEKTFRTVTVDGNVVSKAETGTKTLTAAVAEQVTVGGKDRPAKETGANTGAEAPAMSNEAMWDAIAQCESTGNWSINSGNGYYGGLQFDISSWLANGGGAYAPNASLATKAQQIAVANTYYAKAGLRPWGCAHVVR